MLSILLVSIATVYSTFLKGRHRLIVCLAVLIPAIAHYIVFDKDAGLIYKWEWVINDSTDFVYFGTAAAFNLITISALELVKRSPLVLSIQVINLGYIISHSVGFGMYNAYLEMSWYNSLVLGIFVIEFTRLMITTKKDKMHGACGRFDSIRFNDHIRKHGDIN